MLLFICNIMLSTCNDTSTLDTLDGLGELDTGQDRVRTVGCVSAVRICCIATIGKFT